MPQLDELKYEILGMYDFAVASGMNQEDAYQNVLNGFRAQTGSELDAEYLEEIVSNRAGLKRYQNHLKEMMHYRKWIAKHFDRAKTEGESENNAKFVIMSLFRKQTGYDLSFDELSSILKSDRNLSVKECGCGIPKSLEAQVWKLYAGGSSVNEISLMYNLDPLHVEEATGYWMRNYNERPLIDTPEYETLVPSRNGKQIRIKSNPQKVYVLKDDVKNDGEVVYTYHSYDGEIVPERRNHYKFPWTNKRKGFLERTANKVTGIITGFKGLFRKEAYSTA